MAAIRSRALSRRNFLTAAAAGAGAASLGCRGTAAPAVPATQPSPPALSPGSPPPAPASGAITADTIAAAEPLLAVSYTPAERETIAQTIEDQLGWIRGRRAHALDFDDAPATVFDPRLPGVAIDPGDGRVRARPATAALPADDTGIAYAPVMQLAHWLRSGAITSERLTELYLERLEAHDPALHCVAALTEDRALDAAREADREIARGRWRGILHGVPYGAKDLLDTRGIATGWGAEPYRARVPDVDAAVIARLDAAGAVLVAKLSLGALAYGDIWYGGRTRNPWNPAEGSSGSSAGSAAATAAGLVGFAIGTETLGSIVSPSMKCGTTGLRPTFGRVPRTGAMPLSWTMDKIGAIGRTVEDTVHVLAAIHGEDAGDPASRSVPLSFDAAAPVRGLRVGYDPAWFESEGATAVDRAALAAARRTGVTLEPIEVPALPYEALLPILMAEAAAAFEDLTLSDRDDRLAWQDPEAWPNSFRTARFVSAIDLVQADRLRRQAMRAMAGVFARVEAVIAPSFVGPMLTATNFTGHPSLTLRAGFAERAPRNYPPRPDEDLGPAFSAPHGITLYGRLFREGVLCQLGLALQRELAVWDRRPPGF